MICSSEATPAPNAFLMPNSFLLLSTTKETNPNIPRQARKIETPENTLSTEDYSFGSLTNGNIISDFLELNITISAKEIYIYNSIGQLIKKSKIKKLTNNKINVSELSSGLYYLKTEKNNKPLKFLKV